MFSEYRFGWTLLLVGIGMIGMLDYILWNTHFHMTGDDLFGLSIFSLCAIAAIAGGLNLIKGD